MTWLADFHEKTDLNRYPTVAFRGGIGYRKPSGETISNFVGHPVHYFDNGLWKPITLQRHANGDFEGSDFAWRGKQVFYKGKTLFEPRAVIFNGIRHNLFLRQDGNRIVADLTIGGSAAQYEIQFREAGVRELLTIFEPVEGLLEFDVPHANKPDGLFKKNRHIIGGITAESFQLTAEMTYPLVVDPQYDGHTADAYLQGQDATYGTARSTVTTYVDGTQIFAAQYLAGIYYVLRGALKFDTSGIPDGDNVTQNILSAYCTSKSTGGGDFDVRLTQANWAGSDPVSGGNMETVFDLILSSTLDGIWQNTASISFGNRYDSANLDTSWVNRTGFTYYGLANSEDLNNSAPTGTEECAIGSQDHGTPGNRPYLTVTHAAATTSAQVIWLS